MLLATKIAAGRPQRPTQAAMMAVALAVFATAVAGLTASVTRGAKSPLRSGMTELVTSYAAATGLIGTSWWQAAVALSTVETYSQATGDISFDGAIGRAFVLNWAGDFENNSDDDTAWWALAWLQAYDITRDSAYLEMAETDADYIHEDWDRTCGGGVWWQRNPRVYKNAITNELFLELTAPQPHQRRREVPAMGRGRVVVVQPQRDDQQEQLDQRRPGRRLHERRRHHLDL